jgi:transcriptional regulator with XRE-family HTH domain
MTTKFEGPFFNSRVAKLIRQRIEELGPTKSQKQISHEIGYEKPNMLSMIKSGDSRMPIDKVNAFATVLGIDLPYLFEIVFEQHHPETWKHLVKNGIYISQR